VRVVIKRRGRHGIANAIDIDAAPNAALGNPLEHVGSRSITQRFAEEDIGSRAAVFGTSKIDAAPVSGAADAWCRLRSRSLP
jgi:hypothetical protein